MNQAEETKQPTALPLGQVASVATEPAQDLNNGTGSTAAAFLMPLKPGLSAELPVSTNSTANATQPAAPAFDPAASASGQDIEGHAVARADDVLPDNNGISICRHPCTILQVRVPRLSTNCCARCKSCWLGWLATFAAGVAIG